MKLPCPRCREKGGDSAGDNLHVYKDGAHCHACGWNISQKQLNSYMSGEQPVQEQKHKPEDAELELEVIKGYPVGVPHKPISPGTAQHFGARYAVNNEGYASEVYYPYFSGQQIVDFKKRILPKRFLTITGKINKAELFGQGAVHKSRRGLLVITEGEDDAMAAHEIFSQMGKSYSVVSIPNGASEDGKVDRSVLRNIEFITSFKKVTLCFDNDPPGRASAEGLAEMLAPSCETRLMQLPEGYKDASDMLIAQQHYAFMEALNGAERYTPEGIVEGPNVKLSDLQEPCEEGYSLPYPDLQRKTHGLRKGEVTLLCAGTGIGKTTIARELAVHLVKQHGCKVGNVFLEEQWKKTGQGYIAIDNDVPLSVLRIKPSILSTEQWQASYDKFFNSGKVHYFKHFGSVASGRLVHKMRYFALALRCDFIILDHITMVHSGSDSSDERKDIDVLMTRLAELVTETGVGIIAVVHLKRKSSDISFNEGAEVSLTDLRGSSQLEALSWNVWALERNQQSDTRSDVLTLRCLKNREWGYTGECDKLVYNHQTGRLTTIQKEL